MVVSRIKGKALMKCLPFSFLSKQTKQGGGHGEK
nr:MAG TPA: hypothetical protein [Caudoviricetes sp.]DAS45388.1 MAG TPA: hypothetical protein [Caudoviricetes sp.]DAX95388.1 MAG TPA: hypothetical protein [Caudoviricetes sp.]